MRHQIIVLGDRCHPCICAAVCSKLLNWLVQLNKILSPVQLPFRKMVAINIRNASTFLYLRTGKIHNVYGKAEANWIKRVAEFSWRFWNEKLAMLLYPFMHLFVTGDGIPRIQDLTSCHPWPQNICSFDTCRPTCFSFLDANPCFLFWSFLMHHLN